MPLEGAGSSSPVSPGFRVPVGSEGTVSDIGCSQMERRETGTRA